MVANYRPINSQLCGHSFPLTLGAAKLNTAFSYLTQCFCQFKHNSYPISHWMKLGLLWQRCILDPLSFCQTWQIFKPVHHAYVTFNHCKLRWTSDCTRRCGEEGTLNFATAHIWWVSILLAGLVRTSWVLAGGFPLWVTWKESLG